MKYYIQRQSTEYGPYTLPELQRYVAQGNILMTDLTRSEGMTDWVPVAQVIGNIPVPVQPQAIPAPAAYPQAQPYGVAATPAGAPSGVPNPPSLHWALVLLITFFCGIFGIVWQFVQAAWVRKISPDGKFIGFLAGGWGAVVVGYIGIVASSSNEAPGPASLFLLIVLAGLVLVYVGIFQMRSHIENYYNTVEPINLRLSGVMTFFFYLYYFQYHFTRINEWKKTGYLQPQ